MTMNPKRNQQKENKNLLFSSLYSYRHKLNRLWKYVLCWPLWITYLGQRIEKCSINTVLYCIQDIIICHLLTEVTDSTKKIWLMHLYNGSINTSPYAIHVCSITYMYSINFMLHHLLKLWQHRIKEYTLFIKFCVSLSYFMIEYSFILVNPLISSPLLNKWLNFSFCHSCLTKKIPSCHQHRDHLLPLLAYESPATSIKLLLDLL